MRSEFKPEANESRSPFFVSNLSFLYKVTIQGNGKSNQVITYSSPHEIILNLQVFKDDDQITYINKDNGHESFTITVGRFKFMMAKSLCDSSQDDLESFYLRLILTNSYSKLIVDKGRLRHYDQILKKYLLTFKGGFDAFVSYEDRQVILRLKYRRTSSLHLLAVVQDWNDKNDVVVNHINLPKSISNKNLIYECLQKDVNKKFLTVYNYTPVEEDCVLQTKIDSEINQIINQLIK